MSALPFDSTTLLLFVTALFAAAVNGGLGFGFSTLTVPVALAAVAPRILNPALVLLEVLLNGLSLILNRGGVRSTWRRVTPLLAGVLPGTVVGSVLVAVVAATAIKASTYALLLPLVLLQFSGARLRISYRRPSVGVPAGFGVGVLYATTTISGPPLAMLLGSEDDLSPEEFRGAMALVRLVESGTTLGAYLLLGLVQAPSLELFGLLLPAVALGAPLGRWALTRLDRDVFRRVWLAVDTGFVCAGLALVLHQLQWISPSVAVSGVTAVAGFVAGSEWQRVRQRKLLEVRS